MEYINILDCLSLEDFYYTDTHWKQENLGKVLDKSQQGYNHIEAGRAELKIEDLVTLCKFYNVSSDYIVGLTDRKNPLKR